MINKINFILDSIERSPEMYGNSLEAVEAQYHVLLVLLHEPDRVRRAFTRAIKKITEVGSCAPLFIHVSGYKELVNILKEIRKEVST